jgi:16S rRNA (uracil1498-N3)-methyltransferase
MYGVDAAERLIPGATIHLTADEARHAVTVARLRVGERVKVSNGRGAIALVEALDIAPTQVSAVVVDVEHHQKLSPPLWLIQALAKGGRDEQALEQAVELGVSRVIPWQAARSVSVWRGDKIGKGHARWAKIAREAAKQSLQPWWPEVSPLHSISELVDLCSEVSVVVLDPDAPLPLISVVEFLPEDKPIALVVGPEGGISDEERDQMMGAGALVGRIGPTVLRTSTAGPVALALTLAGRGMWDSTDHDPKDL